MHPHSLAITGTATLLLAATTISPTVGADPTQGPAWFDVSGTGVHYFTSAIVHSTQATGTGFVQRSTDIVELQGDLVGRLLYQPVSVFDLAAGTLVNTGHQVYSGTVLDSAPVLLLDDQFRFEVDLATGATTGKVHLLEHLAGPRIRCELTVSGTGLTPEGDARVAYEGRCRRVGQP